MQLFTPPLLSLIFLLFASDVSKLAQWEVVLEHADRVGLFLHIKLQEQELDFLLDDGELGVERELYYREMIARFGHHLALNWNIGEENGNSRSQRLEFADFIKDVDPYNSPIVIHDAVDNKEDVYGGLVGSTNYNGASLQTLPRNVFDDTLTWLRRSASAGNPWVVTNDEQNPAAEGVLPDRLDFSHDAIRKDALWGNLMAGGGGVEYYFGYRNEESDLTCEDFRSRESMWTQSKYAWDFFVNHTQFWTMVNGDDLVSSTSAHCLGNSEMFVVYLTDGGTTEIDLPHGSFHLLWFDPLTGQTSASGADNQIVGGSMVSVGYPPNGSAQQDWVLLLSRHEIKTDRPRPSYAEGDPPPQYVSVVWVN